MEIVWLGAVLTLIAVLAWVGGRRPEDSSARIVSWFLAGNNDIQPRRGPEFLGYARADLNTIWQVAIAPDDARRVRTALDEVQAGHLESLDLLYEVAAADGTLHRIATQMERGASGLLEGRHIDLGEPAEPAHAPYRLAPQLVALGGALDRLIEDSELTEPQFERLVELRRAVESLSTEAGAKGPPPDSFAGIVGEALEASPLRGLACGHNVPGGRIPAVAETRNAMATAFAWADGHRGASAPVLSTDVTQIQGRCGGCGLDVVGRWHRLLLSGLAVPPSLQRHVLHPDYTEGNQRGAELALASTRIHALGGHMLIGSDAGSRMAAEMLIPLGRPHDAAAGESAVLFVVDDEPAVATFMERVLSDAGYRVRTFTSPARALAAFQSDPWAVDLVVTDQSIPGLSGDVLMSSMLEIRPRLPVILCTGYTLDLGGRAAMGLGAAGYLTKPIAVTELQQLVSAGLARTA